jgi:hypothetical protein
MMDPADREFVLDLIRQGEVRDPLLVVSVSNEAVGVWARQHRIELNQIVQIRGKDDLVGRRRGSPWVLITGTTPDVPAELRAIASGALGEDTLLEIA